MLIIHGDNQVDSRTFLLGVKKDWNSLDGDGLTLAELQQQLGSENLFGEVKGLVVEGFFSRRPSNEKKKIVEQLEKNTSWQIIFWDGKDLGMQTKNFPVTIIKKFDLPKTVFKYLDTFSILDLQQTLENTPAELVFSLLASHVRKLIMARDGTGSLPSWQVGKLKIQAAKYNLERLHSRLLEIDYKNKTSASSMNLGSALELWTIQVNNSM